MDALREDLVARWRKAFERVEEVTAEPSAELEKVYTVYPAYALEGYTPKKFKPGARVSKTKADYTFHRDAKGRPVHVSYGHPEGGVDWRGIYRYGDTEVEHIEVCVQTSIPNLYGRLVLDDGVVVSEQRFVCNCGGAFEHLSELPPGARADAILADPTDYFIYLTRYEIEEGVVVAAEELHEVSGKVHRPTREYRYEDGKLARILQHWPGETRTLFAARSRK